MWLMTETGFYSVVEDRQSTKRGGVHTHLLVRARHRRDLENLQKHYGGHIGIGSNSLPIVETPQNDYPFRLSVQRAVVMAIMENMVDDINYGNFKDRIHSLPDQANKNGAYMEVWRAMRASEKAAPVKTEPAKKQKASDG